MMRKITSMICAAALAVTLGITATAAPSIGELIPTAPEIKSGTLEEGTELVVQNANTEEYKEAKVAEVVKEFNDDEKIVTVQDVLDSLLELEANSKFKDPETGEVVYRTNKENDIDLLEYEALMPFVDLVIKKDQELSYAYDSEGELIVALKVEVAKDLKQEDMIIMMIAPETGELYLIELDEYVPESGEITAAFPCLGPFTILTKGELPDGVETYSWVTETGAETEG